MPLANTRRTLSRPVRRCGGIMVWGFRSEERFDCNGAAAPARQGEPVHTTCFLALDLHRPTAPGGDAVIIGVTSIISQRLTERMT